jgi:hypothetical protein
MKTLIDIERSVWGKVKDFATVHELTLSSAMNKLLTDALTREGYSLDLGTEV